MIYFYQIPRRSEVTYTMSSPETGAYLVLCWAYMLRHPQSPHLLHTITDNSLQKHIILKLFISGLLKLVPYCIHIHCLVLFFIKDLLFTVTEFCL